MAGLPRSFGPDVTDIIMRFAVGYPRDRLRDIVSTVTRYDSVDIFRPWLERAIWTVDTEQLADNLHLHDSWDLGYRGKSYFCASFDTRPPPQIKDIDRPLSGYDQFEYSRGFHTQRLYSTCDACEPANLQLQPLDSDFPSLGRRRSRLRSLW